MTMSIENLFSRLALAAVALYGAALVLQTVQNVGLA
jgi:hypothetical protein